MTLRFRTLLSIGFTLIGLLAALFIAARFSLLRGLALLALLVCAAGAALGAAILVMLELQAVSRLKRLSLAARRIGESKDFTARVDVDGKDAVATIGLSINQMLDSFTQTHHEIQRRTNEMHLLMTSIPVGLLSLNEELRVNPEYSRSVESILGRTDIVGQQFIDVLGLGAGTSREEDGAKCEEFLELLRREALPEKEMAALNPFETLELAAALKPKWIHLSYYLIRRGVIGSNHILAVMEDISEAKALEEEVVRSQQENLQLKAIVEEPELFREFMAEARTMVQSAQRLAETLTSPNAIPSCRGEMFRTIHTIKGIAGAFALKQVALQAAKVEDAIASLRKGTSVYGECTKTLHADLSALQQSIEDVNNLAKSITGESIEESCGMSLRISLAELKRHIAEIQAMPINGELKQSMVQAAKEQIIRRLTSLKLVPASKGLGKAVKVVSDLIRRLGKEARFTFEGKDVPIDCEIAQELSAPLVHLLRNAIDHGLESPEERMLASKPLQGEIKLSIHADNENLVVEIMDDGKGMDPQRLKETALAKKFLSPQEAQTLTTSQCFDLILKPGFTTKSEVTEVSGRGVGLDVVVHSVKNKLKGDIRIESQPGKGSRFILRVPAHAQDMAS